MTIYGYARVSTAEQKDFGLSADIQKQKLIKAGVPPENIRIDGGITAGVKEDMIEYQFKNGHYLVDINLNIRPEFVKLIQELKPNDEIRFLRWDRLTRNVVLSSVFRDDHKRKQIILTPIEDTNDTLAIEILSVISHEELRRTAKRNDSTNEGTYQRGGYPYRSPVGFQKNTKQPDKTLRYPNLPEGCLVIDPYKAPMIKDLFQMMSQGKHYQEICDKYKIQSQQLYNIIRNRTYCGYTHYKNTWTKSNLVPTLITEEQFNKANQNIKTKN